MKILLIEDDAALADVVRRGLSESGHVVDWECDGNDGYDAALAGRYDAIVLDVMLPGRDGFAIARALRDDGIDSAMLMLTARDAIEDIVAGLDAGADDYVRKPFAFAELEARLRAISRREQPRRREVLRVGDVVMDLATRSVHRGERPIELSPRETAFLEFFMRNEGALLTRPMLEDALWERDRETSSNVIEVYVRRLRRKLCERDEPALIHTVRGAGYRFGRSRS